MYVYLYSTFALGFVAEFSHGFFLSSFLLPSLAPSSSKCLQGNKQIKADQ